MDKIMNFSFRAISGIILLILYMFIITIASNLYGNGTHVMFDNRIADIFCVCIAGIITSIWYFLSAKLFRLGYEKVWDYIPSAVLFFISCYGVAVCVTISDLPEYILFMYIAGNCIYAFVFYVIRRIQRATYSDMIKRIMSTFMLFGVYVLITKRADYFMKRYSLGGRAVTVLICMGIALIVTLIYYLVSVKLLKLSYEGKSVLETIVIFSFVNLIFCVMTAEAQDYDFSPISLLGQSLINSIVYFFLYAQGSLVSFIISCIWRTFKEEKNKDVDGYLEEKENRGANEYVTEDEDLPMGSSKIILIPGIDEDFKGEGSSSDS